MASMAASSSAPSSSPSSSSSSSSSLHSPPLGQPLPLDDHACSVSLPTWSAVVGYEEGDATVASRLSCGYPRFVYHPYVVKLMDVALEIDRTTRLTALGEDSSDDDGGGRGGGGGENRSTSQSQQQRWDCLVLPSRGAAARCHDFLVRALNYCGDLDSNACNNRGMLLSPDNALDADPDVLDAATIVVAAAARGGAGGNGSDSSDDDARRRRRARSIGSSSSPIRIVSLDAASVHAVVFPATTDAAIEAKSYWQHAGEVVSSRRAEMALRILGRWNHAAAADNDGAACVERVTTKYHPGAATGSEGAVEVMGGEEEEEGERDGEEKKEEDLLGRPPAGDDASSLCSSESNQWRVCPDTGRPYRALYPCTSYRHRHRHPRVREELGNASSTHDGDVKNNNGDDPHIGIRKRIASIVSAASSNDDDDDESAVVRASAAAAAAAAQHVSAEDDVFLTPSGMASNYAALRSARRRKLLGDDDDSFTSCSNANDGGTVIVYGFPYLDTLKMCGRPEFVPGGVEFFGHGDADDLASLETMLERRSLERRGGGGSSGAAATGGRGEGSSAAGGGDDDGRRKTTKKDAGICALITEFPSNPLLRCPDLFALRRLANDYDFALIVDDTIGNFANLNLIRSGLADVVCTSLTKLFNGRGDALAGSLVTNPNTEVGRWMGRDLRERRLLRRTKRRRPSSTMTTTTTMGHGDDQMDSYDDDDEGLWEGDAAAVRSNSIDFLQRSSRINETTERLADWLSVHDDVEAVYYPKFTDRALYDRVRNGSISWTSDDNDDSNANADSGGGASTTTAVHRHRSGYGGLLSILLHTHVCQRTFYDTLSVAKGPSLGTNFTLACPYTLLAHYHELDFATSYGVRPNLLRIAVGLEGYGALRSRFEEAFRASRLHPKVPPPGRASSETSAASAAAAAAIAADQQRRAYGSHSASAVAAAAPHTASVRAHRRTVRGGRFAGTGALLPASSASPVRAYTTCSVRPVRAIQLSEAENSRLAAFSSVPRRSCIAAAPVASAAFSRSFLRCSSVGARTATPLALVRAVASLALR